MSEELRDREEDAQGRVERRWCQRSAEKEKKTQEVVRTLTRTV